MLENRLIIKLIIIKMTDAQYFLYKNVVDKHNEFISNYEILIKNNIMLKSNLINTNKFIDIIENYDNYNKQIYYTTCEKHIELINAIMLYRNNIDNITTKNLQQYLSQFYDKIKNLKNILYEQNNIKNIKCLVECYNIYNYSDNYMLYNILDNLIKLEFDNKNIIYNELEFLIKKICYYQDTIIFECIKNYKIQLFTYMYNLYSKNR